MGELLPKVRAIALAARNASVRLASVLRTLEAASRDALPALDLAFFPGRPLSSMHCAVSRRAFKYNAAGRSTAMAACGGANGQS